MQDHPQRAGAEVAGRILDVRADGLQHRGEDQQLERQVLPDLDHQHVPAELVVQHAERPVDQPELHQHAVEDAVERPAR